LLILILSAVSGVAKVMKREVGAAKHWINPTLPPQR